VTAGICVSILPKNVTEALNLIKKAEKVKTDFIEIRLDYLKETEKLAEITKSTTIPLIATNKLKSEKGFFAGTETERQQTLLNAAKSGFEYIDVDFSSSKRNETLSKLRPLGVKAIISYHDFDGILATSDLEKILNEEIASGAEVCKIVLTANQIEENLLVLNFVSSMSNKAKLVCFCMGEKGKTSRLLSPLFGAYFTFASLESGNETATGQLSITEMKMAYQILGVP
jgi:3-dehydroquinate dehydratase type I